MAFKITERDWDTVAPKSMVTCEKELWNLVRNIEPSQTQKDGAIRSHNYLRDVLSTGQMASRIIGDYLSGSYSRDTAINPLDDVDIIFLIEPKSWTTALDNLLSFNPDPSAVLTTFANAIRYRYPESSVYGQRRSVRLKLFHLDIDVVPAILADRAGDFILIPDRDSGKWIKSSPKRHSDNATAVNKIQNGKFKPLVKLLKYWNGNLPTTASFKSFAIETIAVRAFNKTAFQTLEDGLLYFFDFVAYTAGEKTKLQWKDNCGIDLSWLSCNIPDAAGTGSNVVAGIDGERKKRFIKNAIGSRNKLLQALNARSIDTALKRMSEALKIKSNT